MSKSSRRDILHGNHFVGRFTVLSVVLLGVLDVQDAQVIDCERVPADAAVLGEPLDNQVVVPLAAFAVPHSPR